MLALNWAAAMHEEWDTVLVLHRKQISPSFARTASCDLFNEDAVSQMLDETAPNLVVHTAGLTNVEMCEADPELAKRTNVDIARVITKQCRKRDIKPIMVSTDHLFASPQERADENTPVAPVNVYGRTKADGENAALDANPKTLVARTNFFCWGTTYRRSFSDTILDALRAKQTISLFTDVFFTPILASQLAKSAHVLARNGSYGIYNLAGDQRLSKHAFGLKVATQFGLVSNFIKDSRFSDRTDLTPRPYEMGLDNRKARAVLNKPLGNMDTYLPELMASGQNSIIRELKQL